MECGDLSPLFSLALQTKAVTSYRTPKNTDECGVRRLVAAFFMAQIKSLKIYRTPNQKS
jgi:hypothetical protein